MKVNCINYPRLTYFYDKFLKLLFTQVMAQMVTQMQVPCFDREFQKGA